MSEHLLDPLSRISIGLVNPKSATNVASVLRACGCYGGNAIFYTGERYRHAKAFHADTQNWHRRIPTVGVEDLLAMKPKGAQTVVVELVEGATPLPMFNHPDNAYYIFGPEDGTVPQSIVDGADDVVYVPTFNSMNLAATANVVLYDRLSKRQFDTSSELIKSSRDTNNNTVRKTQKFDRN